MNLLGRILFISRRDRRAHIGAVSGGGELFPPGAYGINSAKRNFFLSVKQSCVNLPMNNLIYFVGSRMHMLNNINTQF